MPSNPPGCLDPRDGATDLPPLSAKISGLSSVASADHVKLLRARLVDPGEEVVPLVVNDDEGGEVDDLDLPDRLHPELRVLEHLDLTDAVLGEARGRAADRPQVKAAVLLAGLGHGRRAVALGQHHHAAALR